MTEPKPLPSETKLVERGVKMLTEEHLAKAICLYNGIALQGPDGSEQWWPFCSDAERMLANADGELESALASLADELRLAREALVRLGSMEAFKGPRAVNEHDAELLARIDFARAALKDAASSGPKD